MMMKAKILGLLAAGLLAAAPAVNATTSLLESKVTILYDDRDASGGGGIVLEQDLVVIPGPEVSCTGGAMFGLCTEGILLPGESIDIGGDFVAFDLVSSDLSFPDPALFNFLFAFGPGSVTVNGALVTSVSNLTRDGENLEPDDIPLILDLNVLTVDLSLVSVRTSDSGGGGLNVALTLEATPEPIPEPSTFALLGAGLLGLFALRRRTAVRAA